MGATAMNLRTGLLLTCAVGALAVGTGLPYQALAADMAVVAAPATDSWWYTGSVEVGGRFFLNNPQRNGISALGGSSLAKYYEYSSIKPGPFADGWAWMGSKNGLYEVDLYGKNVGYNDQRFVGDFSKAGEHYLSVMWDETPHLYSTSALTLFNGVGSNALTIPADIYTGGLLFNAAGCIKGAANTPPTGCTNPVSVANAPGVQSVLNSHVHNIDVGIRRDTAALDYRWTPTDAWDVRTSYSNMRRTGTQVEGVVFGANTDTVTNQVPKPVADTTQNFGASGEYAGISPWNQRFNLKVAYNGSIYKDDFDSYTIQNPFCPANVGSDPNGGAGECARGIGTAGQPSAPIARMSLWPDNQANGVTGTLGADLPFKSRYMGTVSYTDMRQNQAFIPFTISPLVYNGPNTTAGRYSSQGAPPALPYASLNGDIDTLLFNNVLTTQITPDLKSKASYRYYNFQNNTPELFFNDWVETDAILASSRNAGHAKTSSISISYKRQNAGEELTWQPTRAWNIGASYGWERYDRVREDVDVTNEHTVKGFVDWKPAPWLTGRGSLQYGERRYDTYDYLGFVGNFQWQGGSAGQYSTAYRQFFLDNRDRTVGRFLLQVDVAPGLTVTPSAGWRNDEFLINRTTEEGLIYDRGWNAGVEVGYVFTPGTNFLVSYMYESRNQLLASAGTSNPPFPAASNYFTSNVDDKVNTVMVAVNQNLIPDKLDLRLGYTLSYAVDRQPVLFANGTLPAAGQIPDVKTTFQRFDAIARYKFDDDFVRKMGWTGHAYAKLRYAWERNSVLNWQNDLMQSYMYATDSATGYMSWMAYDNPNYNVHLLAASVAWTW